MTITPFELFSTDERGYAAEYYHERLGQHLIIFSKAGSVRGRHYHKGLSLTKNPEILIVLSGICVFNWRTPNSSIQETAVVTGPAKVEIPAYTWHELIAETDTVLLELNSLSEHAADTFYDLN